MMTNQSRGDECTVLYCIPEYLLYGSDERRRRREVCPKEVSRAVAGCEFHMSWKMVGKCLEDGWKMVENWLETGWKMTGMGG